MKRDYPSAELVTLDRRRFIYSAFAMSAFLATDLSVFGRTDYLSHGKKALEFPHLNDRLTAFVWRNWFLVPVERIAETLNVERDQIRGLAYRIGLPMQPTISNEQFARSYITVIRRNWHLLPTEQLLVLLGWSNEKLEYILKEDDFLDIKLGPKPLSRPVKFRYSEDTWIKDTIAREFPDGFWKGGEPLFSFIGKLSSYSHTEAPQSSASGFEPRFGYSYFTLFGDPLLDPEIDPFPIGYLQKMVSAGMDSTWLHVVLSKITPFPWDGSVSDKWEQRLANLADLVNKCNKYGVGIYLYLNEPRYLPLSFFDQFPDLKGEVNGDQAALCTSHPDVQAYLVESITTIVSRVPGLAGFFSITASENRTHCWSHGQGDKCPRCGVRGPEATIAELNNLFQQGIDKGIRRQRNTGVVAPPKLIIYDWAWKQKWIDGIVPNLPKNSYLMSVSEWGLDIERGGVKSVVGEYSISSIGPSHQALSRWDIAKKSGLKTIAKIQAGNSWEIAAVPYIPAIENVAQHAWNLKQAHVDGLMLGWSQGGYPSPNMEVVAEIGKDSSLSPLAAMKIVADRHFGEASSMVVAAWRNFSAAFSEFPYHIGVIYRAPLQAGPANLLWSEPTGYQSTMVGFGYDDLEAWRSVYPTQIFIEQLYKVSRAFKTSLDELLKQTRSLKLTQKQADLLTGECRVAETVGIHIQSVANQSQFIALRDEIHADQSLESRQSKIVQIKQVLEDEIEMAKRMFELQHADSRLGFEASNHYFYIPGDLVEKVLNCRFLLDRWIPTL